MSRKWIRARASRRRARAHEHTSGWRLEHGCWRRETRRVWPPRHEVTTGCARLRQRDGVVQPSHYPGEDGEVGAASIVCARVRAHERREWTSAREGASVRNRTARGMRGSRSLANRSRSPPASRPWAQRPWRQRGRCGPGFLAAGPRSGPASVHGLDPHRNRTQQVTRARAGRARTSTSNVPPVR